MTKNLYTGIFLVVLLITGQTYAAGNETNTRNGNSFSVDNDWLWYSEALLTENALYEEREFPVSLYALNTADR